MDGIEFSVRIGAFGLDELQGPDGIQVALENLLSVSSGHLSPVLVKEAGMSGLHDDSGLGCVWIRISADCLPSILRGREKPRMSPINVRVRSDNESLDVGTELNPSLCGSDGVELIGRWRNMS